MKMAAVVPKTATSKAAAKKGIDEMSQAASSTASTFAPTAAASTSAPTAVASSLGLETNDARAMYGRFINYVRSLYDGLNIEGLMAERDGLTRTHLATLYTTNFKRDVLGGKKLLDDDTWNNVKEAVVSPATLESMKQYINSLIIEEKKQPATPTSSSSRNGKRFARPRPKGKARLKPIKEDEEVVELIQPARNHLPCLDMNNDVFVVNKINGKKQK